MSGFHRGAHPCIVLRHFMPYGRGSTGVLMHFQGGDLRHSVPYGERRGCFCALNVSGGVKYLASEAKLFLFILAAPAVRNKAGGREMETQLLQVC